MVKVRKQDLKFLSNSGISPTNAASIPQSGVHQPFSLPAHMQSLYIKAVKIMELWTPKDKYFADDGIC